MITALHCAACGSQNLGPFTAEIAVHFSGLKDIEVMLTDGKYHDVDSSQDAFKSAAVENFRDAQMKAGIVLLEPIMNVMRSIFLV